MDCYWGEGEKMKQAVVQVMADGRALAGRRDVTITITIVAVAMESHAIKATIWSARCLRHPFHSSCAEANDGTISIKSTAPLQLS